jgi:hypothetical protein
MAIARKGIYRDIDIEKMQYFDIMTLNEVECMAAGLEPEEVLAYYGLTMSEIEASSQDHFYFCRAYNKGRTEAKRKAVQSLFQSMGGQKGKESSICYLKHFGSEIWKKSDETDGADNNFKFTVTIPNNSSY